MHAFEHNPRRLGNINLVTITPYLLVAFLMAIVGIAQLTLWYLFPNEFLFLFFGVVLTGFGVALISTSLRSQKPAASGKSSQQKGKSPTREDVDVEEIKVLTEIKCRNCNDVEIRDFKRGDHVFKPMPKCPKCAQERYISSIFSLPPEDEDKKKIEEDI